MVWVAVGVAAVGAIASNVSSNKARHDAASASASQREFDQARVDEWNAVYGPIQENLGEYYNNLTPDYYEAQGIQALEEERTQTLTAIEEDFAQRGITNSGIAASAVAGVEQSTAVEKARVRLEAPIKTAGAKANFLQIGMGNDPTPALSNTLGEQAASARNISQGADQAASKAFGNFIEVGGTALGDYMKSGKQ